MAVIKSLLTAISSVFVTQLSIINPVLPVPPMGFNNWARFQCNLNESLFNKTADAMVNKGLLAAGYNRLNLDDCWMEHTRAKNGSLQWNTTLFPSGIPKLAQNYKAMGFSLGIYENSGNVTCGGYPGSKGYEELDAKTFVAWGIDYLKLDGCNVFPEKGQTLQEAYKDLYGLWHSIISNMSDSLAFSESAPAYFSGAPDFPVQKNKSNWYRVMNWAPLYGELARHSTDIAVYGYYKPHEYWESIMTNYGFQVLLARYQEPGFYNDPDFLIMDWPWLSLDEKKSQFALWASFSAPLIISAYVPDLSADVVKLLTNEDIIKVDQDPLGLQATLVSQDGTWDVLTKTLVGEGRLLTVLNRGNVSGSISVNVDRIGLKSDKSYTAKDLWTGAQIEVKDAIKITLQPHATAIYRFSGVSSATPTGMIFNTASLSCLTASNASLIFANCTSADSQVWQITEDGHISPLSASTMCMGGRETGVELQICNKGVTNQQWIYQISGNLVNKATKLCLTERLGVGSCGDELDSQVFGLPSGVEAIRESGSRGL